MAAWRWASKSGKAAAALGCAGSSAKLGRTAHLAAHPLQRQLPLCARQHIPGKSQQQGMTPRLRNPRTL